MLKRVIRWGDGAVGILAFTAVPYLPLVSLAFLDGAQLRVSDDSSSRERRVSSLWPAGDRAPDGPSLFSLEEVRRRARGWKVRPVGKTGWRSIVGGRCKVEGDVEIDDLRAAWVYAEAFAAAIEGALGMDVAVPPGLAVRVFRNRNAFDVYASVVGAKGSDSFYDPRSAEAVIWWTDEARRWPLLMHELAHAWLDGAFRLREPLWLTEGIADWFMSYRLGPGGAALPGGPNPPEESRLAKALDDGALVPLGRLLSAGREEFYGERRDLYYAEAWSLVRSLATEGDALRKLARCTTLESLVDLQELERRWIASIKEPGM